MLLVMRPVIAWPVFAVIATTTGWMPAGRNGLGMEVVHSTGPVVIGGLIVYGLTWLARSVAELRATRLELAHVAVAQERLRFARDLHDLHDLLGLSLIGDHAEERAGDAAGRHWPERARAELTVILDISRLVLADVRLVASG